MSLAGASLSESSLSRNMRRMWFGKVKNGLDTRLVPLMSASMTTLQSLLWVALAETLAHFALACTRVDSQG